MKLENCIEFIKFINAYIHRKTKKPEEFMKGILKIPSFNETNSGSVFMVKNMYASDFWCIKFYCDKACATILIFAI